MGCCLSCLEHRVWSRFFDRSVRYALNRTELIPMKPKYMEAMDAIKPIEMNAVYQGDELIAFKGIALSGCRFTVSLQGTLAPKTTTFIY